MHHLKRSASASPNQAHWPVSAHCVCMGERQASTTQVHKKEKDHDRNATNPQYDTVSEFGGRECCNWQTSSSGLSYPIWTVGYLLWNGLWPEIGLIQSVITAPDSHSPNHLMCPSGNDHYNVQVVNLLLIPLPSLSSVSLKRVQSLTSSLWLYTRAQLECKLQKVSLCHWGDSCPSWKSQ